MQYPVVREISEATAHPAPEAVAPGSPQAEKLLKTAETVGSFATNGLEVHPPANSAEVPAEQSAEVVPLPVAESNQPSPPAAA